MFATKPCYVCQAAFDGRSKLCPRCRTVRNSRHDRSLKPDDLRAAYDMSSGCFRCIYSGVCLEENDPNSPYYRSTDHYIPGEKKVVLTGLMFNLMKSSLTGPEFVTVVPELDDHHRTGRPFNKDIIKFSNWNRLPAPPLDRNLLPPLSKLVNVQACIICGLPPLRYSYYCARCRKLVWQHGTAPPRQNALRVSYSRKLNGFICYYTGILLDLTGRYGPWHISLDHRIPGDEDSQVVAALWVNRMKTFLTEAQFWAVIHSLADHIRTGAPFDTSIVTALDFGKQVRKLCAGNPLLVRRV